MRSSPAAGCPSVSGKLLNFIRGKLFKCRFVRAASPFLRSKQASHQRPFYSGSISVLVRGADSVPHSPSIYEVTMLDLFYVGVAIGFFVLLWGFTKASERL